jgi:plastocyanin
MVQVNTRRRLVALTGVLGLVFAMMAVAIGASPVSAQDDQGHPAHIHTGTCDDLGEVVYPLSNVGPGEIKNGKSVESGDAIGATEDIYPVEISITSVDTTLAEIADGNHAVNVHESSANIQNYIACGNIGGQPIDGDLIIGLEQRNDSGYTGIAVIHPREDYVVVTVYLSEGLAGEAATPDNASNSTAAPTQAASPATDAVDISGFAFSQPDLQIAAGTTVTWTNQDSANHTVTSDDGAFDSGQLAQGGTFSWTFDTPGTYTYHCANHPNMTATVTVS